jgi:hypothetical protein
MYYSSVSIFFCMLNILIKLKNTLIHISALFTFVIVQKPFFSYLCSHADTL